MTREYTDKLLEILEEYGSEELKDTVIMACLKYMSEDDVKDMCRLNGLVEEDEIDEKGVNEQ